MDLELAKKTAEEAVRAAGKIIMDNLNKIKKISYKHKSDIATDVDYKCEKEMIKIIKRNFPNHTIFSEESGEIKADSEYTWVMDPIDGSINYSHGYPPFRTAVCLLKKDVPLISAIFNPVKNQLYFTEKGKGATLNNKKIHVNNNRYLEECMVMTHLSSKRKFRLRTIKILDKVHSKVLHIRMFGSGLSSLCYIAKGNYEAFFNVVTYPWDILPGALLIEEAGGKVTDIKGRKITLKSNSILATNGKVHRKILRILKGI